MNIDAFHALQQANIRLKAQRDKLLEALQDIEKMPWPNSEAPYAIRARAAIKEAEGEDA